MAIQLLRFRELASGTFKAVVWLDDTKLTEGGNPDPDYLREYDYGPVPQGVTRNAYLTQIKRETKLLVQQELAQTADQGTALAGEGQAL